MSKSFYKRLVYTCTCITEVIYSVYEAILLNRFFFQKQAIVLKGMAQTIKDKQVQRFLGTPVLCGPVCTIFCPQITTAGTTSQPTGSPNRCVTINQAVTMWNRVACPSVVLQIDILMILTLFLKNDISLYDYKKTYMNKVFSKLSLTYLIKKKMF